MRFAILTLGCKVNQYESQALEQAGTARGHTLGDPDDPGGLDAYIVNTCTVTAVSDQKNRQLIRRLRREHPEAVLAVCGCFPQTHPGAAEELGADLVCGTGDRNGFWAALEGVFTRKGPAVTHMDDAMKRRVFEELPAGGLSGRTRALLKVEDGCCNFCSYCIIPYARGPVRSLPLDKAAAQAAKLAGEGFLELVVNGIEISSWGRDLEPGLTLMDLLETLSAAAPGVRLRLGSLEPRTVTPAFCRRASALPDLCHQFHLSLQSGCDATLKRMNRKYDTARYFESVELLNQTFRRPAVTTDLITGFPGETEEEFEETLAFIRKCGFARIHVFPYSVRPGTPAADMEQIPVPVREERARRAGAVAEELRRAYLEGCVGEVHSVLFEQPKAGGFFGHAGNYAGVLVPAEGRDLHNQIKNVRITGVGDSVLLGEIEEEAT